MAAVANTVALPVVSVIHQISANPTRALPKSEKAWPIQMVKKGTFQPLVKILLNFVLALHCQSPRL